ncbi:HNH endonuclease [Streptomyces sp. NPDC001108]
MTDGAESFYAQDSSARASWRLAILMGANSRTYKFALGEALLELAASGRRDAPLAELAAPYALSLVRHLADAPQVSERTTRGESDFLSVAGQESEESLAAGRPTERLLSAATRSMPGMVMQKFHNLRGGTEVGHTFYEVDGSARERTVRLTPELLRVARSEQADGLRAELGARWSIVERSFETGIGRSLMAEGVVVDWQSNTLMDTGRRRSVAGVTEAVIGFQHGRCLICDQVISPTDPVAVDHVFPFSLMKRMRSVGAWNGPDLDALWNLAPAHTACNGGKSDRLPSQAELRRLALRNEAITDSPHPLRKTLELSLRAAFPTRRAGGWPEFLRAVEGIV